MALLVLLQGFNPLPNYVVANYLLSSDQTLLDDTVEEILVFYSEKNQVNARSTCEFACRVKTEIEKLKPGQIKIALKPLSNINDGQKIRRDIDNGLKESIGAHQSVHLSYSGGTKSTSVHSYMAFETICKNRGLRFSTSYLDDRRHVLYWNEMREGVADGRSVGLYYKVKMTMGEFLSLHGYKNCSDKNTASTDSLEIKDSLPDLMVKMWKEHREQYGIIQAEIKKVFYFSEGKYQHGVIKFNTNADQVKSELDWNAIDPVVPYLPTLQRIKDGTYHTALTGKVIKADEYNVRCIRGIWFEDYVRRQIYQAAEKLDQTVEHSWALNIPDTFGQSLKAKRTGQEKFELDVYLIVGYQLIGISVTTDASRHVCKSKGFEVIHRTRQIGGDGRMAFLVTMLSNMNRDNLKPELESDSDISERFQVFGESDFDTIGSKIVEAVKIYGG